MQNTIAAKHYCIILIIFTHSLLLFGQNNKVSYSLVTEEAGIDFRYTFGDHTYENILESSGSGITILDYNSDGWYDIYMLNGTYIEGVSDKEGQKFSGTSNKLYKNNGDGTFSEVSEEVGVDDKHWSMAAGAMDYDNDGDVDIYLLNYGPNVFYRNNGNGTFTDIAAEINMLGPENLNGFTKWSVGVAFWDINKDGLLDAMVGNFLAFDPEYVSPAAPDMMPHPSEYKGQPSLLYIQQTDGSFKEMTQDYNLYYPDSKCMGLTVFDYEEDGDLDLFQGNDHQFNFLFRNDNGKFTEIGSAVGVAANSQGHPTGSMHGTIGDINGDGLIDLLVTDLKYGALYQNQGNGFFTDVTESNGISVPFSGKGQWGASLFDFDNDCDLDIFSANGTAEELILQVPLLLENNGSGRFIDMGERVSSYFTEKRSGRAAATFDYDNDGDLDIIISHVDLKASASLLRNDGGNNKHWLGLLLIGKNGPAATVSAKVVVHAGDKKQTIINQCATSYLSYNDPRIHIGLGSAKKVDKLEIFWSDNSKDVYENISADQYLTITQK